MANRTSKRDPNDLTTTELIEILGWNKRTYTNRLGRFYELYKFKEDYFHEGSKPLFKKEWKDYLIILLKAMPENPFFRENAQKINITPESIIEYNSKLVELIDEYLPENRRYEIKNHPTYIRTIKEIESMKNLTSKFSQLLAAMSLMQTMDQTQLWKEMYETFDTWIFSLFKNGFYEVKEKFDSIDENKRKAVSEIAQITQLVKEGLIDSPEPYIHAIHLSVNFKNCIIEQTFLDEKKCGSLDGLLALYLKRLLENTKEKRTPFLTPEEIQEEKDLDQISDLLNDGKKFIEMIQQTGEERSAHDIYVRRFEEQKEIIDRSIDEIRTAYEKIHTMEKEAVKIINDIQNEEYSAEDRLLLEEYLPFFQKVKEDSQNYMKDSKLLFEKPIINSLEKGKSL